MEFKNGYKLVYEKTDANGRKLYATKDTVPSENDDAITLPNDIADAKVVYEAQGAFRYNVNSAEPGADDASFVPTVGNEIVLAGGLNLTAVAVDGSKSLFNKAVSELQQNIVINADGVISGTSHYVTGYKGFSPSKPAEQEGNYIALLLNPSIDGATIVFNGKKDVTLDDDRDIVIILGENTTSLTFTATYKGLTCTKVFTFGDGFVKEQKQEVEVVAPVNNDNNNSDSDSETDGTDAN